MHYEELHMRCHIHWERIKELTAERDDLTKQLRIMTADRDDLSDKLKIKTAEHEELGERFRAKCDEFIAERTAHHL